MQKSLVALRFFFVCLFFIALNIVLKEAGNFTTLCIDVLQQLWLMLCYTRKWFMFTFQNNGTQKQSMYPW